MKHYRILLALTMLILASLACQAVLGGGNNTDGESPPVQESVESQASEAVRPTDEPSGGSGGTGGSDAQTESDFPMTDDAFNVVEVGDGSLVYYTRLSAEEAMEFYRAEYTSRGYTEREILTVTAEGTFSLVFDGDPSGEAVVIQSVDLGDGSRTIAIRLEDI